MGTSENRPTVDYTAEHMSFLMATNFDSAYNICQLAHPLLKASGSGSIVFVSSVAGVLAVNVGSLYCAAKGNYSHYTVAFSFWILITEQFLFSYSL